MPPNFANSRPEFSLLTLSAVAAPSTALSLSSLSLSAKRSASHSPFFSFLSLSSSTPAPPLSLLPSTGTAALAPPSPPQKDKQNKQRDGLVQKKPGAPSGGVHSNLPPEVAAAKAELIDVENTRTPLVEELRLVEKQVRCDER